MIYNCFTSNNNLKSFGNPSAVFLKNYTEEEMSMLAKKVGTPISCFVRILGNEASVKFFAPNGKKEGFCGHGLISVARALKDKGFSKVNKVLTESGITVNLSVLQNGISSLKIPTSGFDISSSQDFGKIEKVKTLFSLKDEVLEVFQAGKLGDLLFELKDATSLQNLKFDKEEVLSFLRNSTNLRAVMFFCKGSLFEGIDAEIRVFYVNLADLEDIACGSVNISVARVLHSKYGIESYKSVQPFSFQKSGKIGGYQEVHYDSANQILSLNGFTENAVEEIEFQNLEINFDDLGNVLKNSNDYEFMSALLKNEEVMKTSTAFALQVPKDEQDLHSLIKQLIEIRQDFNLEYGFKKVFSKYFNKFIGIAGVVKTNSKNVVEYGIFISPEYSGFGFGKMILKNLFEKTEQRDEIIIGSIWEENIASIQIAEQNGMIFLNHITKEYEGRVIQVRIYAKYPKKMLLNLLNFNVEEGIITKQISY
jgi:PhzF family phenazine biosynthesis protein